MGTMTIPVDIDNPGQVFACLGLIEAADVLCGGAEGGFTWDSPHDLHARFTVAAAHARPVEDVVDFLAHATPTPAAPEGWSPSKPKGVGELVRTRHSPGKASDLSLMALPVVLGGCVGRYIMLGHWADGSSRDEFKLYAGNRSAAQIAGSMIDAIRQLWQTRRSDLLKDPFGTTVPMRGSFNFDARCVWEAIDLGYSPNDHRQMVLASPVVELLAAWGLEHARPKRVKQRVYSYGVWSVRLPAMLARPALGGTLRTVPVRRFQVRLGLSGKNKVIGYAEEETNNE